MSWVNRKLTLAKKRNQDAQKSDWDTGGKVRGDSAARRTTEISSGPALGICPKFLEKGGREKQKEQPARGAV